LAVLSSTTNTKQESVDKKHTTEKRPTKKENKKKKWPLKTPDKELQAAEMLEGLT
jgi:hypothetical protein